MCSGLSMNMLHILKTKCQGRVLEPFYKSSNLGEKQENKVSV